jgi:transposase
MKRKTKEKSNSPIVDRRGAPKYDVKYDVIVKNLAEKGLTLKEIYKTLDISEQTGINWKKKYPSFLLAIKQGRAALKCTLVEKSLLLIATGHEHYTQKALVVSDGKDMGAHVEKVKVKEYFPPQINAIKYFLDNRKSLKSDPENGWADKQSVEHSGTLNYKITPDDELEPENKDE